MEFPNHLKRPETPFDTKPRLSDNDDDSMSGGVPLTSPGRVWWKMTPPLSRVSNSEGRQPSETQNSRGTGSFGLAATASTQFFDVDTAASQQESHRVRPANVTTQNTEGSMDIDVDEQSRSGTAATRPRSRKGGRGRRGRELEDTSFNTSQTFDQNNAVEESPTTEYTMHHSKNSTSTISRSSLYSPGTGAMQQVEAMALLHTEMSRTARRAPTQSQSPARTKQERGVKLEIKRKRRPGTNIRPDGKAAAKAAKEAGLTGPKTVPKAMHASHFASKAIAKASNNQGNQMGGTASKLEAKDRGYNHRDLIAVELTMAFSGESMGDLDSKTRKRVEALRNDFMPADPMAPLPDFDETVKEILFRARKREEEGNKIKIANKLRMDTQYAESNVDVRTLDISEGRKNRILELREQSAREAAGGEIAKEAREKESAAIEEAKMKERLVRFG